MEFTMEIKHRKTRFIVEQGGVLIASRLIDGKLMSIRSHHNDTVGHLEDKCEVLSEFSDSNFAVYSGIDSTTCSSVDVQENDEEVK